MRGVFFSSLLIGLIWSLVSVLTLLVLPFFLPFFSLNLPLHSLPLHASSRALFNPGCISFLGVGGFPFPVNILVV